MYGDPLEHPQTETYWGNVNCIGERSCYDEGKRAAECLTFDYKREHNTDVRHTDMLPSPDHFACSAVKLSLLPMQNRKDLLSIRVAWHAVSKDSNSPL